MATMDPKRVVQVNDLTVRFKTPERTVEAVRSVSFHVDRGETLAIVGESGSGKSVTSLALMRLVEYGGGRIVNGGMLLRRRNGEVMDLLNAPDSLLQRVRGADMAMIFQEPMTSLNPVFTAGDQIAEAIRLHQGLDAAAARAETLRMLERVRIPEAGAILDRYPHQLSGGMRQRVMIAMALSCQPRLLIADEPTTALDVTIQAQILQLIRQLQEEMDMGVIFITHDMGVVAEVADRVLVMYRGDKVEEGGSDEIFARPRHAYTRALLSAVPRLGAMQGTDEPSPFPLLRVDGAAQAAPQPGAAPAAPPVAASSTVRRENGPVLKVRDLTTSFDIAGGILGRVQKRVHAVEKVSFDLYPGETLSLVGESGCGKTTTGRSLLRLVKSKGGTIEFDGRNIGALRGAAMQTLRQHIQFIFQDPFASLDPRMTVGDSIMEPLLIHGVARGKAAQDRSALADGQVRAAARNDRPLPARILRRPAPAHLHRARPGAEPQGGDRRRIRIGPGRLHPGADREPAAGPAAGAGRVVPVHFARHGGGRAREPPGGGDVFGADRRDPGPRRAIFENPQHPYTKKLMAAVPIADPRRRHRERSLLVDEIPSPVRKVGDDPLVEPLVAVGDGHFVARHAIRVY